MRLTDTVIVGLPIVILIATEVTRSVVHRHRERTRGIGGTQDIALYGTVATLATAIFALVWIIFCMKHPAPS